MPYKDSDVRGGKVRVKCSTQAGETIAASGLVPGELALNAADGAAYYQAADGGVGQFPSATGFLRIAALTQAAYNALAVKDASTLYIIAATIVSASWDAGVGYTLVQYTAPESDGGSAITLHHLYVDGVEIFPISDFLESGEFYEYSDLTGSVVEVSVENEVGEGPKSASFAVI